MMTGFVCSSIQVDWGPSGRRKTVFSMREDGSIALILDECGNLTVNNVSGRTEVSMSAAGTGFQSGKDGAMVQEWNLADSNSFKGRIRVQLSEILGVEVNCSNGNLIFFYSCKGVKYEVSLIDGWRALPNESKVFFEEGKRVMKKRNV
mmetsp:Transcript_38883/g.60767  ORF Transcript_38883/g.60767 Transcript_38883/m.60767 type:complete len:148 (+) Transcript_38883:1-444(+)